MSESFSQNLTCSSIINNRKLGRWRDYWKDLVTYYDNETDLSSVNYQEILTNIHRNENEDIKDFIIRLDNAITNCRSHNIKMSQILLKSKLKSNTKGFIKSMVISKISSGKRYNHIRAEVLNMSNSDPNNELDDNDSKIYTNNTLSTSVNTVNSKNNKSNPIKRKNVFDV